MKLAIHNRLAFFSQFRSFSRPARLFLFATIMDGIVFSAWGLFFNFYILGRGFSRDYLGLVNALPAVATLVFGLPMGLLSDRIGRKRAMILGVAGSILAMGLQVTVRAPGMILVMAFLSGMTSSLYFLSQAPFMMKVSDSSNRTLLFSLNFGLVTLAGAVGSLFAGQLPALFGAWLSVAPGSAAAYRAVLLVSVALSFLTLVPLMMIDEGPKTKDDGRMTKDEGRTGVDQHSSSVVRHLSPLKQVLSRPLTYQLALPNLCIGFGAAILIPYVNVFFRERHAIPDASLGLLFSLSAVLTGVGSIVGPRLAHNLGSKIRAVVLTQGLSLLFLLVIGFSPLLWLAAVGFLARGTLMNMAVPLYSTFAMEQVAEREQGAVNSVKELAWQVGWAVGPYLSGVVQQAYGFTPLFITTAVMYAAAILLTWAFFRDRERAAPRVGDESVFLSE